MNILDNLKEVVVEKPVDIIIKQIRKLLNDGYLKPGDRLPSERKLAERFGIGRTHVRDAIKKLEFYGILKTLPQSGTVVSGLEIKVLEGLITDILKLDNYDFSSLTEVRLILEMTAARYCAMRRSAEDLQEIEKALLLHEESVDKKSDLIPANQDFLFHRKIAEGSKNQVLKSMLLTITPDILKDYNSLRICSVDDKEENDRVIVEHRNLFESIKNQDPEKAAMCMKKHLERVMRLSHGDTPY
jgi:GntR family transcriptional repressor for pyruvate dehydrogenase complex